MENDRPASPRHRLALDPPDEPLVVLSTELVLRACDYARTSPRRRVIQPFHRSEDELLHRMLNAVQPDSYIRPHRHLAPPKAEAWILLRGSIGFFTFDDGGAIETCLHIGAGSERFGVDLVPGVYHTFVALEPDTVIYEVKTGPYRRSDDKDFAPWAPAEGEPEAAAYLAMLREELHRRTRSA